MDPHKASVVPSSFAPSSFYQPPTLPNTPAFNHLLQLCSSHYACATLIFRFQHSNFIPYHHLSRSIMSPLSRASGVNRVQYQAYSSPPGMTTRQDSPTRSSISATPGGGVKLGSARNSPQSSNTAYSPDFRRDGIFTSNTGNPGVIGDRGSTRNGPTVASEWREVTGVGNAGPFLPSTERDSSGHDMPDHGCASSFCFNPFASPDHTVSLFEAGNIRQWQIEEKANLTARSIQRTIEQVTATAASPDNNFRHLTVMEGSKSRLLIVYDCSPTIVSQYAAINLAEDFHYFARDHAIVLSYDLLSDAVVARESLMAARFAVEFFDVTQLRAVRMPMGRACYHKHEGIMHVEAHSSPPAGAPQVNEVLAEMAAYLEALRCTGDVLSWAFLPGTDDAVPSFVIEFNSLTKAASWFKNIARHNICLISKPYTLGGAFPYSVAHGSHGSHAPSGRRGGTSSLFGSWFGTRLRQDEGNFVDVERIKVGLDTRTTIMLRNVPQSMTRNDLLRLMTDWGLLGRFDFLYLRVDFKTGSNVGYGFINFTSVDHLLEFVENHDGQPWYLHTPHKRVEVSYATHQGIEALDEAHRNSAVMLQHPSCRPRVSVAPPSTVHSLTAAVVPWRWQRA